jgi:putative redox protein
MAEKVVVLQTSSLESFFWAPDPQAPEPDQLVPIEQINALTPSGMLLASLGSCTATVLHTYAKNHGLDLQDVELRLQYGWSPAEKYARHRESRRANGKIQEEIVLYGNLSAEEHHKLLGVAHRCSVHRMLNGGLQVKSLLAPAF